jgi:hypothetical protein
MNAEFLRTAIKKSSRDVKIECGIRCYRGTGNLRMIKGTAEINLEVKGIR